MNKFMHNKPFLIISYNKEKGIEIECGGNDKIYHDIAAYFCETHSKELLNLPMNECMEIEFLYRSEEENLNCIARVMKMKNGNVKAVIMGDVYSGKEYRKILERKKAYSEVLGMLCNVVFVYNRDVDALIFFYNIRDEYNIEYVKIESFSEKIYDSNAIHDDDKQIIYDLISDPPKRSALLEARLRLTGYNDFKWYNIYVKTIEPGKKYRGTILNVDKQKNEESELKKRALYDPLTKLYNRAAAIEMTKKMMAEESDDAEYAVFILDIDNFKNVNDKFGHLYGDAIISMTARIIKNIVGENGVAGRFGGDEFIVFMRRCERSYLKEMLESIRKNVTKLRLEKNKKSGISCSIGVTFGKCGDVDFERVFHEADSALYEAKEQGKNRVVFFNGEYADADLHDMRIMDDESESDSEMNIIATAIAISSNSPAPDMAVINVMQHLGYSMNFSKIEMFCVDTINNSVTIEFTWQRTSESDEYDVYSAQKRIGYYFKGDIERFREYFKHNKIFLLDEEFKKGFSNRFMLMFDRVSDVRLWYSSINADEPVFFMTAFHSSDTGRVLTERDKNNMLEVTRILNSDMKAISESNEQAKAIRQNSEIGVLGLYKMDRFYEECGRITRGASENDLDLAVINFDFENFYKFNRIYGAKEGDRIMKLFAEWLMEKGPERTVSCHIEGTDQFITIVSFKHGTALKAEIEKGIEIFSARAGEHDEFPIYVKAGVCLFKYGDCIGDAVEYARELKRDLAVEGNIVIVGSNQDK